MRGLPTTCALLCALLLAGPACAEAPSIDAPDSGAAYEIALVRAPRLKPETPAAHVPVHPDYVLPLPLTHKLHRQPVGRPYRALGRVWTPRRPPPGYTEAGRGSWYGKRFHGKLTSSGEVFSMYDFTAAHKTLPFDTFVRVTLPRTGKSAVVRINDRGPFVADRIIDLSRAVADEIGMRGGVGSNRVVVEVLE